MQPDSTLEATPEQTSMQDASAINAAHERARVRGREMCDALRAAQDREMAAKGFTHVQRGQMGPDGKVIWENKVRELPGVHRRPAVSAIANTARESHRARPGHRRGSSSSSSASADPPSDPEPAAPAPPLLTVAPPPRAIYAYGIHGYRQAVAL